MTTNVVLWGLGAMASHMVNILLNKRGFKITGAIANRSSKAGQDLGRILKLDRDLGVTVTTRPEDALRNGKKGVVLHATRSFVRDIYEELRMALEKGYNVISIAEELAYPYPREPDLSDNLNRIAKANGVSLLGTGVNPGFAMDTLIIALTGVCADVTHIHAKRINDLSCFGPTVMKTQGVGAGVDEFEKGIAKGEIVGHIGFQESIHMIADSLGWKLDEIIQTKEAIITSIARQTEYVQIEKGQVAGCCHIARGIVGGCEKIVLEHPQQIRPEMEGVETGDFIRIRGTPDINLNIKPEIAGGVATAAIAVNMIPRIIGAAPGLWTMKDLPIPSAVLGTAGIGFNSLSNLKDHFLKGNDT